RVEAGDELRVLALAAGPGQDRDHGRQDVRIERPAVLAVARVELARALLRLAIVAEDPQAAQEVAAELAGQLVLVRPGLPAQPRRRGTDPVADECLEPGPRLVVE